MTATMLGGVKLLGQPTADLVEHEADAAVLMPLNVARALARSHCRNSEAECSKTQLRSQHGLKRLLLAVCWLTASWMAIEGSGCSRGD
ncbi:MAG: hypothetical protein JOY99_06125 [Sphingomonadaceae bacterium]|nr:hypothetical protein [Sphingomonadaceae bacterium]